MPDVTMQKCPQCGQRTTNLELAECPYCQVALVKDSGLQTGGLTREQTRAVALHLLGSWKLWAIIILLVAGAAWGVVQISQKAIDARSKEYLNTLEERTTNRLAIASAQISRQVSDQVESEFKQPRMQTAMEQAARERVNEALTTTIKPTVDGFQQWVIWANRQLAKSTNELAKLDRDIKETEYKLSQVQIPQPSAVPANSAATKPAVVAGSSPSTTSNAPAAGPSVMLTVTSQAVSMDGQNYILSIFLKPVSPNASGPVNLMAGTLRQSGSKIINFGLVTAGQSQPMVLNDTLDAAQLNFSVAAGDSPVVAVEVTAPTIVQLSSSSLGSDLVFPVAAEKLVHQSTAK
jgi:hypothetical protein